MSREKTDDERVPTSDLETSRTACGLALRLLSKRSLGGNRGDFMRDVRDLLSASTRFTVASVSHYLKVVGYVRCTYMTER